MDLVGSTPEDDAALFRLVANPSSWIHRRVETLHYLADGSTRRNISIDFTVYEIAAHEGVAPVALLEKKMLHALDVRSSTGDALPVFTREENAAFAVRILSSGVTPDMYEDAHVLLTKIVRYAPNSSETSSGEGLGLLREFSEILVVADDEIRAMYLNLAESLLSSFLLLIQLPREVVAGRREIAKVSYETSNVPSGFLVPRLTATRILPSWSQSFHFEVRAPQSSAVAELSLMRESQNGEDLEFMELAEISTGSKQISHIETPRNLYTGQYHVAIKLVADRRGLPALASLAAATTLLLMSAPLLSSRIWFSLMTPSTPGAASSILLLGPAVLFALLARGPEHEVVAYLLRGPRLVMVASGLVLFLGACTTAGVVPAEWVKGLWLTITFLSGLVAIFQAYWWKNASV